MVAELALCYVVHHIAAESCLRSVHLQQPPLQSGSCAGNSCKGVPALTLESSVLVHQAGALCMLACLGTVAADLGLRAACVSRSCCTLRALSVHSWNSLLGQACCLVAAEVGFCASL